MRIRQLLFVSPVLLGFPFAASAQTAMETVAVVPASPPTVGVESKPGPFFVHASFGINAVTYIGAYGSVAPANASVTINASNHFQTFEQLGFGYWILPHWRVQLTGMLGETVTSPTPAMAPPVPPEKPTLMAIIPWIVYTNSGFFGGAGPLFAPRAFGHDDFNVGFFTCAGYGVRIYDGLSLALAVQVPILLADRVSVGVTPALIVGERF